MPDTAGPSAPQHDLNAQRHTLSLEEVMAQLVDAGVPHSKRHIQRLCQSGLFDAQKLPGGSGDEWFVSPDSVPKAIGDLRALQERRARRAAPQRAALAHVAVDEPHAIEGDTAGH